MDAKEILDLVEKDIASIVETRLADRIRELLVAPRATERLWDYGRPDEHFTCWTVLEH